MDEWFVSLFLLNLFQVLNAEVRNKALIRAADERSVI